MISIIVPIHRVEAFLDVCILSIMRQTYKNIEIILVDDGSPDCCGKICDHYATIDSRIKVVHKPCGGPSDARNAGLAIAQGDYIGFVDSDDYVAGNMFETLVNLLEDHQADIAICGHVKTDNWGKPRKIKGSTEVHLLNAETAIKQMLQVGKYESFVWNKLFRREIFQDITFPKGKLYEDLYTTYKLLAKAKKIVYTSEVKYYYRQRLGSIIHTVYSPKYYDYVHASKEVLLYVSENFPAVTPTARVAYFRARAFTGFRLILSFPQQLLISKGRRKKIYKRVQSWLSGKS